MCGQIPADITSGEWVTIDCKHDGIVGSDIKIQRTSIDYLIICGIKVYIDDQYVFKEEVQVFDDQVSGMETKMAGVNEEY